MKLTHSLILAAASCGLAFGANTAFTIPVGYETLSVASGFNYLGLRMQQPVVAAGLVTAVDSSSITCGTLDLGTLLADTTTYILEVTNANGVTQEFLGSAAGAPGSSIITTTPVDLSAKVAVNDAYKIRTAPTLASTFGPANEAGLDTGFFGIGGDIVFLTNPATVGGFDLYYYDSGQVSWANSDGVPVDGAAISWNYADALVISATGAGAATLTVSGEVKLGNTGYNLPGGTTNYVSTISPVGATLASAFDAAVPTLDQGFFGIGGDVFYVPNPLAPGGLDVYYYDGGQLSWCDALGTPVTASAISLPAGLLIYNDGAPADVVSTPPATYSALNPTP